jgi:hypothetical protein
MKIKFERQFFHYFLIACSSVFFLFSGMSCQADAVDDTPTKIVGTWHQTSLTKDGVATVKDSSRLLLQINSNSICVLCDSTKSAVKAKTVVKRSGWSYTAGLFNLAVDLPAAWKPIVDTNTLSIERVDFNQSGAIYKTTLKFERVANIDFK